MKDIGFTLVSTHAGAGDIAKNGDKIIADAKALGLKYVVCSSPGVSPAKEKLPWEERMKAVDLTDWKWNADLFNKFGKQVSDAGMVFGYHNHSAEFKKFDGKTGVRSPVRHDRCETREDRARRRLGGGGAAGSGRASSTSTRTA